MELYEIAAFGVLAILVLIAANRYGLSLGKLKEIFEYLRSKK